MNLWTSSKRLLREVIFKGYFENLGPLRIGAGREAPLGSPVDLSLLRIKISYKGKTMEVPYIPGSSLKGVFRSQAEALARAKNLNVCSGLSKQNCMDEKGLSEEIQYMLRMNKDEEAMKVFFEKACLMCKIFGSPGYASKIIFSDAFPVDDRGELVAPATGIRTGIAIDRRTGAVYRGALYQVEYIEPGVNFNFTITSRNLPNYALGLLAFILLMLKRSELKLGGFKTRGFGEVTIKKPQIMIRCFPFTSRKLAPLDENDKEQDLDGLVDERDGWLLAYEEKAWEVLEKLEGVWRDASIKS